MSECPETGQTSGEYREWVDQNMVTRPLGWPYIAKEQRDRAAEAAIAGIKDLEPCLGEYAITQEERIKREARALDKLHKIARLMQEAGAPIRT